MGKTDLLFHQYVSVLAFSLASVQAPRRCNIEFQRNIVKKLIVPFIPWLYCNIYYLIDHTIPDKSVNAYRQFGADK